MEQEGITRKELATRIGTSPSYITQLFRGDKILNLTMMARIQEACNIKFDISIKKEESEHLHSTQNRNKAKTRESILVTQ